jgi:uncharacterized membrane protein (UPF0127 family)
MTSPACRSTRREARGAPLLGALLLVACTGGSGASPGTPAPAAGPRVVLPSGTVFALEVARTPEQVAQGLMFRESLAPASGMVFVFDAPRPQAFWMKNCHFALDMVFALADGTVVDVIEGVPPCAADPCPSYPSRAPADTVVELAAGEAKRHGVVRGARLRFLSVPER